MKRSDFLKTLGVIGAGSVLPTRKAVAGTESGAILHEGVDCVLIPQETRGPYPLDLSNNPAMFRQDVTEGRPGLPLNVIFNVVNINSNCAPIANARIDIWQTDKEGVYSGFQQPGSNTVGQTFMRGIQLTDANGRVEFKTVYPGWYQGRITHIHFEVYLNSVRSATSQGAFPDELNRTVYATPLYASKGQNTSVASNANDMVFSSGPNDLQHQLFTMSDNATTGGYNAELTVGINAPASAVSTMEPETGGQFTLEQNSPNPFRNSTSIGFNLVSASNVDIGVFDMQGKRVATIVDRRLEAGEHHIDWNPASAGTDLPAGNYVFQLTVANSMGRFNKCKVMTIE